MIVSRPCRAQNGCGDEEDTTKLNIRTKDNEPQPTLCSRESSQCVLGSWLWLFSRRRRRGFPDDCCCREGCTQHEELRTARTCCVLGESLGWKRREIRRETMRIRGRRRLLLAHDVTPPILHLVSFPCPSRLRTALILLLFLPCTLTEGANFIQIAGPAIFGSQWGHDVGTSTPPLLSMPEGTLRTHTVRVSLRCSLEVRTVLLVLD